MEKSESKRQMVEELRPHFIFNVLNQLRYLVKQNPNKAEQVICDFANYLRLVMGMSLEEETNLWEEVKYVKNYVELEMLVHPNVSLDWNVQVPEENRGTLVKQGSLYQFTRQIIKRQQELGMGQAAFCIEGSTEGDDFAIRFLERESDKQQWCEEWTAWGPKGETDENNHCR